MFRIPSIHHYCNRWCERCTLRQLCGYYQAKHQGGEVSAEDWAERIPEPANTNEFADINLAELAALPEKLAQKEARGDFDPNQSSILPLYDRWQQYFSEALSLINEKWEQATKKQNAYVDNPSFMALWNARETLLQHRNFVGPKLHRALGGRFDAGGEIPTQSDWNGSAKALILVLHEIESVINQLQKTYPENDILKAWGLCNADFREQLQNAFPNYMKFKRPGFDASSEGRI